MYSATRPSVSLSHNRPIQLFLLIVIFCCALNIQAQPPAALWSTTFGGSNIDIGHAVQQTNDGGFIIAGYTRSFGSMSGRNALLVKTDSTGALDWQNGYGGDADDEATAVVQTSDDGYVFTGYTKSFGLGLKDVLLMKTDSSSATQWIRAYGGAQDDEGYCLQQTADGGFIIAGVTSSAGAGSRDGWLIKTDATGAEEWRKTIGGFSSDGFRSVQQTSDGGYILCGWTLTYGPGFLGNAWLVKTDSAGVKEWDKFFGGSDADRGYAVQQTADGGYILAGYSGSSGAGLYDVLLIKTDAAGNAEWEKTFGGSGRDYGHAVQQTTDGGYIVCGYTLSFGAGGDDLWLIKTNSGGSEEWQQTFGGGQSDVGYGVRQTGDGGYVAVGHTLSSGAGLHDVILLRLAPENAPLFSVTPDSLIFSGIAPGDTLTDSLRVTNSGTADLIIHAVTVSQPFISVSPAAATIAPDSSAGFGVQLIAGALPGSLQGIVAFHHNGQSSPDSVRVRADVVTSIAGPEAELPQTFELLPNYPNPFNPATTIRYYLARRSSIKLEIYNTLGQKVRTFRSGDSPAGVHHTVWNGRDDKGRAVASGIYFCRLTSDGISRSRRLLLMR